MLTSISHYLHKVFDSLFGINLPKAGFVTYMRNIQWTAISKFSSMGVSLVTTMLVARMLGPSVFGTLNYVLSLIGIFTIIGSLGVSTVVYKELVAHKENRGEILASALTLTFSTGVLAILAVLTMLYFIPETMHIKVLAFMMSLSFLTQPFTLLGLDFLKDNEVKFATVTQLATLVITSVLKVLVVYLYASIGYFIIVLVLENFIAGCLYSYQIKKIKGRTLPFHMSLVSKAQIKYLFWSSLPLAFMIAFTEIYARIDQVMLKHYINTEAVGLYSAAVRLTEVWYFIPNILITSLFPSLVNSSMNSRGEHRKRFTIFILVLLAASLLISFGTLFLSKFLVMIIYGKDFLAAIPILSVYIFSLIGSFLSILLLQELFLRNKKWQVILLPASTSLLNIVLNIYLIPKEGAIGAAIATVISYNVIPVLFYFLNSKDHDK